MERQLQKIILAALLAIIAFFSAVETCLSQSVNLSQGQTVYVPVYSHIYVVRGHSFDLGISLCIRNTDSTHSITILSVSYNDADGKLVRNYLQSPTQLRPLASKDFFVTESDTTGGLGASFLIKWRAETKVNEPIIEGVMAGTKSGQGISFITRGKAIKEEP